MTIKGTTKLVGVLGWPVAHSRSPLIHNYWIEEHGLDAAYVPLPVRPEDFGAAIAALGKLGFVGANVTVPHKEAALAASVEANPLAARVGAVNTVVFAEDGTLRGLNTDVAGFLGNLRGGAPGIDLASGVAVVLGAGGAARAVVAGLIEEGDMKVRLVNRTRVRAESLAADLGGEHIDVVDWDERASALDGADLLVNTTSLGMTGSPPLELDLDALPVDAVVNDLVYAPLATNLLKAAAAKGCCTVDGLGMLLHQAAPAFEAWFSLRPEVTPALRAYVLADLGAPVKSEGEG